jgi:hypothetical protein
MEQSSAGDEGCEANGAQPIAVGVRHETLKQAAVALRKAGLSGSAVSDALRLFNEKHCVEPLAEAEVRTLLAWASDHIEAKAAGVTGPAFNPVPLDEFMKIEFPEPKWIVLDLIPEGCTLIAGTAKKGNSCTMHHVGLAVALGGRAFGHFQVEQGECLYYSLEGGAALFHERCRKLRVEEGAPAFHVLTESKSLSQGALDDMEGWIRARRDTARVIVVDTLVCLRDSASDEGRASGGPTTTASSASPT